MAAIENLEIIVEVDIAEAVSNLQKLQDELEDLADKIAAVDARGSDGISVRTHVDSISDDLMEMELMIQQWEARNGIDIDTNVRGMGGAAAASAIDYDPPSFPVGGDTIGVTPRGGARSRGVGEVAMKALEPLSDFGSTIKNADIRMSDLHNMMARIVPLLVIFLGAIPSAIAALYTLAAAGVAAAASLMALAGFGALGFALEDGQFNMDRLTQAFERVRQDFIDAFGPMAERLQPLFEDGLAGLEDFFDAIADEGDALIALTDEARAFGGFIMEFVPSALRTLAALVSAMSGTFGDIGDFLNNNFADIVRTMVRVAQDALPVVAEMGRIIASALPAIAKMSIGFARVANVIMQAIGAFMSLLSLVGIGPEIFGILTASVLALFSAFLLWNSSILAVASGALMKLGAVMIATIGKLTGYSLAAITAKLATWGLYRAVAALLGLTGVGLILVAISTGASMMADQFARATGNIDKTAKALKDFDSIRSGLGDSGFDGDAGDAYGFNPEDPKQTVGAGGGTTVFNVESSGDPSEDRSNIEYADWMSGRSTGE